MIELLKKTLLAGVGVTLLTKDRVEELAREIARSANMSADKGQAFVDEAIARAKQGQTDLEERMQRIVRDTLQRMNCASRDDVAALTARVEQLERRLAEHQHS